MLARLSWRDGVAVVLAILLAISVIGSSSLGTARAASPGVDRVYIANGTAFADALVGGPNASLGGAPILLVRQASIPDSTAAELTRLQPGEIVILGGAAVVSAEVETALAGFTSGAVRRIGGLDRFETAVLLAAELPDGIDADTLGGLAAAAFATADDLNATNATVADLGNEVADLNVEFFALDAAVASQAAQFTYGHVAIDRGEEALLAGLGPLSFWVVCRDDGGVTRSELVGRSTAPNWWAPDSSSSPITDPNPGQNNILLESANATDLVTPEAEDDIDGQVLAVYVDGTLYHLSIQIETALFLLNVEAGDCVTAGTIFSQIVPPAA